MDKTEQAMFEARAVLQAHANLLANVLTEGASPEWIVSQAERIVASAKQYAALRASQWLCSALDTRD